MGTEILSRMLISALAIGTGIGAYWIVQRTRMHRASGRVHGIDGIRKGIPVILYFTTPSCAICKTTQRPAILEAKELMGDSLQVIEIDAALHSALADEWGVMSVPTTVLIDAKGRPRQVNNGLASKEKLIRQVNEMG
jgi:thioredoxin 1